MIYALLVTLIMWFLLAHLGSKGAYDFSYPFIVGGVVLVTGALWIGFFLGRYL